MLLSNYQTMFPEAGCDEAGRGCLAGPVVAAAVVFPRNYSNPYINDSKRLSKQKREELSIQIQHDALAYSIAFVDVETIDKINILRASFLAMHQALDALPLKPSFVIVDGNRFRPYLSIPYKTIVKGDSKFLSIAAASILAKTARDAYMRELHDIFPVYGWDQNKGYATWQHRKAIAEYGMTVHHRKSFTIHPQLSLL
jgi:ribonuclease HII